MKALVMMAAAVAVGALLNATSPKGGGPGEDEGFWILAPAFSTQIIQGDRQTVLVSLKREKYFKQDVKLEAEATHGLKIEPRKIEVKASDPGEARFQVMAPKDAALGKYRVHVVGTPETGLSTSIDFEVDVVGS